MSACISREGEYSEHVPDTEDWYCSRCGAMREADNIAQQAVAEALGPIKALADEWTDTAMTDQVTGSEYAADLRAAIRAAEGGAQ